LRLGLIRPKKGPMARSYAGKRAFITGGSSGIGKALAAELVAEGAHVCIAARGRAGLDAALAELRPRARSPEQIVTALVLDVGDDAAVMDAAPEILAALGGGLDLLVNNAGIAHPAAFLDTPPDVFETTMRVNFHGVVHVTRALLPSMIEAGGGQIAIVSSLAGVIGIYGYTAYSASKFALLGFAECLRQDLLIHGVGVSVILPGDTDTPQLAAENLIKPAQTKAIAGNVEIVSAEFVARAALAGLRRGRYQIVPGFASRFSVFMARRFPALTRWVLDAQLRQFERKQLNPARK
jgi:3-dehydrosphinganine reductase